MKRSPNTIPREEYGKLLHQAATRMHKRILRLIWDEYSKQQRCENMEDYGRAESHYFNGQALGIACSAMAIAPKRATACESFVSVPTAKLLAEAGFNEPCKTVYIDASGWNGKGDVQDGQPRWDVPTQSLAARWLRGTHGIHVAVMPHANEWYWELRKTNGSFLTGSAFHNRMFQTYEEALEVGLREALKFIIN